MDGFWGINFLTGIWLIEVKIPKLHYPRNCARGGQNKAQLCIMSAPQVCKIVGTSTGPAQGK